MKRAALVLVMLGVAAPAAAEPYRWPLGDGNRTVTAYYDHGGTTDWRCGSNTYGGHDGTDIGVPKLTPVFAAAAGWVKARADGYGDGYLGNTDGGGFGNHVALFHGDGDETIYGHLSAGTGVPVLGTDIGCGAMIGGSGTSGSSTGPHLHFETRVGVSETGSYYSGSADDPYAGECGGPQSYCLDQAGDRPVASCDGGTIPTGDDAAYVADVTIPDGTEVVAGVPFTKVWRLRNLGDTTWGAGYALTHVEGPSFDAAPVAAAAAPDAEVEIAVTMTTTGDGIQRSSWRMARDGEPFGETVWVEVLVVASPSIDGDGDGVGPGQDCDDGDAAIHPGAEESCDGVDADCDGAGDDGLVRMCCDTGMQTCGDGAWAACDVVCEEPGDDDAGGCDAGGGGQASWGLLLVMLGLVGRQKTL